MGTLIVRNLPSQPLPLVADHTYVECGTGGRKWPCWGRTSGGAELRRASGSTKRANRIAVPPKDHAQIACFLINGVCHQTANRILLPAGITVQGCLGYDLSEAIYGTYGRPQGPLGFCKSPFDRFSGVTIDLAACVEAGSAGAAPGSARERSYLRSIQRMYRHIYRRIEEVGTPTGRELEDFQLRLFQRKVRERLSAGLGVSSVRNLLDIRRQTERSMMTAALWFERREMTTREFVRDFDRDTVAFQDAVANVLTENQYERLLGMAPGQHVLLSDPLIVREVYGDR